MRPIVRGPRPFKAGIVVEFKSYSDARNYLMERIGQYCSYCEMPCPHGPDVEHIQPKSRHPEREMDWSNLLLACRHCNSAKGHQEVVVDQYVWPDTENTFLAFEYRPDQPPSSRSDRSAEDTRRAERTIALIGLDRKPGHPRYSSAERDTRWQQRFEAWRRVERSRERFDRACQSKDMIDQIVETARATGFWSVWMTAFADQPDVTRNLLSAFPGTAGEGVCFDQDLRSIPRRDILN